MTENSFSASFAVNAMVVLSQPETKPIAKRVFPRAELLPYDYLKSPAPLWMELKSQLLPISPSRTASPLPAQCPGLLSTAAEKRKPRPSLLSPRRTMLHSMPTSDARLSAESLQPLINHGDGWHHSVPPHTALSERWRMGGTKAWAWATHPEPDGSLSYICLTPPRSAGFPGRDYPAQAHFADKAMWIRSLRKIHPLPFSAGTGTLAALSAQRWEASEIIFQTALLIPARELVKTGHLAKEVYCWSISCSGCSFLLLNSCLV